MKGVSFLYYTQEQIDSIFFIAFIIFIFRM